MISQLGFYSLNLNIILTIFIIFKSLRSIQIKESYFSNTLYNSIFLQFFLVIFSFTCLVIVFVTSDFSNIVVFNNSHTTKPLFYKLSGVWGNHEGSLLLWLFVLVLFLFLFISEPEYKENKYKILTVIFQEIIILGFLIFIIATSNPFEILFPIPLEGLGLNPILQDPALAIHPPILYLGYVGTSLIFQHACIYYK